MPRFVILRHDHPHLHWDFMLETGEVLRAWRLEREPLAGGLLAATALGDHRVLYLDYEGPVSGGRGTVTRFDAGEYLEESAGSAKEARRVSVRLFGERVSGQALLEWKSDDEWSFVLSPDQ